jgi:porphyrinogen peroxidase
MSTPQGGILADVPSLSRYLEFNLIPDTDPLQVLRGLAARSLGTDVVIGFGAGLVIRIGGSVEGLRSFQSASSLGCNVPSTQADVWCWIRGADRGEITHLGRSIARQLAPAFRRSLLVDGFKYDISRDLSGYEDGTENPEGDDAVEAEIVQGAGKGLDGSSFVAVQKWVHDLDHFQSLPQDDRDNIIGRHVSNNEEFDEAPESAHVKRRAQESFDPEAFVVRRSMPWSDENGEGLVFVSFGKLFDAFEAQLRRMTGQEDGIIDGLFRFTRRVSGSYFWCPPVSGDRLDLSALGL